MMLEKMVNQHEKKNETELVKRENPHLQCCFFVYLVFLTRKKNIFLYYRPVSLLELNRFRAALLKHAIRTKVSFGQELACCFVN